METPKKDKKDKKDEPHLKPSEDTPAGGRDSPTARDAETATVVTDSTVTTNPSFERNPTFRLESGVAQRIFVKIRCDAPGACVGLHLFAAADRGFSREMEVHPVAGGDEYAQHVAWREYNLQVRNPKP